jgi:DUF917 family protein
MRAAEGGEGVVDAVVAATGARVLARGAVRTGRPLATQGGFDHGSLIVDGHEISYLNEFLSVTAAGERLASYPDTISMISMEDGRALAVKDVVVGAPVAVLAAGATTLPCSTSACDVVALAEVERITGIDLVRYLPPELS